MVVFPALAPTRFIGATPLLEIDRARAQPITVTSGTDSRPRPFPEPVVERAVPRLAAIDARRAD